jgi:hypothetical protein
VKESLSISPFLDRFCAFLVSVVTETADSSSLSSVFLVSIKVSLLVVPPFVFLAIRAKV